MAKISKFSFGGAAGLQSPQMPQNSGSSPAGPAGPMQGTASQLGTMASKFGGAPGSFGPVQTALPATTQGGPMGRPGMGGQFGRPGMPTGRGGGINPTPQVTPTPVSAAQQIQALLQQRQAQVSQPQVSQPQYGRITEPSIVDEYGMPTPVSQPSVTPTPVSQPLAMSNEQIQAADLYAQQKAALQNQPQVDQFQYEMPNEYGTSQQLQLISQKPAYKKGGAVNAYKKGGSIKSMDSKPSKNYTSDGGRLNLGSGRVSTAQKNKKSSNW